MWGVYIIISGSPADSTSPPPLFCDSSVSFLIFLYLLLSSSFIYLPCASLSVLWLTLIGLSSYLISIPHFPSMLCLYGLLKAVLACLRGFVPLSSVIASIYYPALYGLIFYSLLLSSLLWTRDLTGPNNLILFCFGIWSTFYQVKQEVLYSFYRGDLFVILSCAFPDLLE